MGGSFEDDPYPAFHRLRETGPVHEGTPGRLIGFQGQEAFQGLPVPRSAALLGVRLRDLRRGRARPGDVLVAPAGRHRPGEFYDSSMLSMDGDRHRRYRALVQPSFVPKRARWWIENWIDTTVNALIDSFEAERFAPT